MKRRLKLDCVGQIRHRNQLRADETGSNILNDVTPSSPSPNGAGFCVPEHTIRRRIDGIQGKERNRAAISVGFPYEKDFETNESVL